MPEFFMFVYDSVIGCSFLAFFCFFFFFVWVSDGVVVHIKLLTDYSPGLFKGRGKRRERERERGQRESERA